MTTLLPWIGLFGPFAVAAFVLVIARMNEARTNRASETNAEDMIENLPQELPSAVKRGFLLRPVWPSARSVEKIESCWQDAFDEARASLRCRYPYRDLC